MIDERTQDKTALAADVAAAALSAEATKSDTVDAVRPDLLYIVDEVDEGSRVLDLGCGTGALLGMLAEEKGVRGTGIEIVEDRVYEAASRGVTVHHGDFNEALAYYPDRSFDYVILSQTLQQAGDTLTVLNEALRVGRRVVASFPNFGHWRVRLQLLLRGRAPVTRALPYQWYDTPNVRSLTVRDFRAFAGEQGMRVVGEFFMGVRRRVRFWPNLRAVDALFFVEKKA